MNTDNFFEMSALMAKSGDESRTSNSNGCRMTGICELPLKSGCCSGIEPMCSLWSKFIGGPFRIPPYQATLCLAAGRPIMHWTLTIAPAHCFFASEANSVHCDSTQLQGRHCHGHHDIRWLPFLQRAIRGDSMDLEVTEPRPWYF